MISHHTLRRIIGSYGRCRRYAPFFQIDVLVASISLEPVYLDPPRLRFTWFATATLTNGKTFCRALNVDISATNRWCIRESSNRRKHVPDPVAAFADWLESVEDDLSSVAFRGFIAGLNKPSTTPLH